MCRKANCRTCGKTTWAGCGQHVDSVMSGVAQDQRCVCTPEQKMQSGGFLSRLFKG